MSPDFIRRVMASSGCARSTVVACLRNAAGVREVSRLRVQRAIAELGLTEQAAQYGLPMAITSNAPLEAAAGAGKVVA